MLASGSARVFIAGADLKTIQFNPEDSDGDRKLDAYLAYGQRVFGIIAGLGCPTAAAIGPSIRPIARTGAAGASARAPNQQAEAADPKNPAASEGRQDAKTDRRA